MLGFATKLGTRMSRQQNNAEQRLPRHSGGRASARWTILVAFSIAAQIAGTLLEGSRTVLATRSPPSFNDEHGYSPKVFRDASGRGYSYILSELYLDKNF